MEKINFDPASKDPSGGKAEKEDASAEVLQLVWRKYFKTKDYSIVRDGERISSI